MKILCVRVSSAEQNTDRQRTGVGEDAIFHILNINNGRYGNEKA